jgi:type IV pilus assembly protein PilC
VPVLTALGITADTLSNTLIRRDIKTVQKRVADGESISKSLKSSIYFPPLVINMLAVGEESGQLGDVTQRVADAYEVEVDRAMKAFTALLEPIIIVIMGVIVGFLVIAMLLPMLTLSSQIR